jgi:glutaredoxin 2
MIRVPDTIQEEVLTQLLQGMARDMMAKNVGISKGTTKPPRWIRSKLKLFLDNIAEYCFKKGMTAEEFINSVNETTRVSSKIKVPIGKLHDFITDK